jgi:ubiquinone/menaquinone biosynthesis C-methylase UbiE
VARVDYDKQSDRYDAGRGLPDDTLAIWMAHARRHAGDASSVLDLGAGTGRFSAALADAFASRVFAVEPSAGMREQAAPKQHPDVRLIAGRAEAIPLRDATVDFAWLSNVIHHFDDLTQAAAELRRVVVPGGTVLVRGAFGDTEITSLFRFFPATRPVLESFPTRRHAIEVFHAAGFTSFFQETVPQLLAKNLAEMLPRTRLRADSTLELISDEEFAAGIRRMEEAAKTETGPVIDDLDLLVVR